MKIIFLIPTLGYGGAERQLVALAKGLHRLGHNIQVAVFYSDVPLAEELIKDGIEIKKLDKQGRWDVFGFLKRLVMLLRKEKPDILHGYLGIPNILSIVLKPFLPRIRMVWGVRASNMDLSQYGWLSRLAYILECKLSRMADLIIANSHAGLDYAATNGFPREKMIVIPNGIDTKRFYPDPKAGQDIRLEWGIKDEKLIGIIGRIDPMKDHPTFLKAAALLAKKRKDVKFICVGDGSDNYGQEIQNMSRELGLEGQIIWTGPRRDMLAVYNALDIVTSASITEGFSNVVGEAMACGIHCVVTDVGDSAWIVGETGEIVPPRNPQAILEAWEKVLSAMDKKNLQSYKDPKERVGTKFSLDILNSTTEKYLMQIINKY